MFGGVIDSIIASIIEIIFKYTLGSDVICKIRFFITNPIIYSRFICIKKYPVFKFDFIEIKKVIFNKEYNKNNSFLKKINYDSHGKNYLNFTIKESGATYRMEITNEIKDIEEDYNENLNFILKIKSTSPTIINYRDCNDIVDLKSINTIYKIIEKKYNLIETFSSYELIASNDKEVSYPERNIIKENEGSNQIIYNSLSLAIKSDMFEDLLHCLDKYKLKLFKNKAIK